MQVTHKHGVDLILSNTSSHTCEMDNGDFSLRSDGELAFASFDADGLRSLSLIGGTRAEANGHEITHPLALEGLLIGFDDLEKTLEIRPDHVVSDLDFLSGKTVTICHRERGSAYTIRSAENNPDGTCTLTLEGYPHLAIGYLLVTAVEKDCVWVEPPPVIQGKETNLNLFRVDQNRSLFYLQPFTTVTSDDILDEKGSRLRTRHALTLNNPEDLSADTEIALSPLHPGVDRFQIIQSSCWTRE